ncbi:hypothetical protein GY45DRAFT_1331247 [Cubamyces sp. BRFM 1775]|nr:hypothetical protein GY45DRAFT_1331247 [Cubamyces sp. BRFM 1775]
MDKLGTTPSLSSFALGFRRAYGIPVIDWWSVARLSNNAPLVSFQTLKAARFALALVDRNVSPSHSWYARLLFFVSDCVREGN